VYSLTRPTDRQIEDFIASQQTKPFSYPKPGATRTVPPPHYTIDHNRICLGYGAKTFEQAKIAIRRWLMFDINWLKLCWPHTPIEPGATVAILAQAMGIWSLNACRIVYAIDQPGEQERFGFAYGTLPEHAERGEERFTVAWHHADDSVWYDILAFSRPNQLLAKVGYPYVRRLQKQFAAASMDAVRRHVANHVSQPSLPVFDGTGWQIQP